MQGRNNNKKALTKANEHFDAKLPDGNILFTILPHEILGMIAEYLTVHDFICMHGASKTARNWFNRARLSGNQLFWDKHRTNSEAYLVICKQRYLDQWFPSAAEAKELLAAHQTQPVNIYYFGNDKLKQLCLPSGEKSKKFSLLAGIRRNLLNLPSMVVVENVFNMRLQEVFGLNGNGIIPAETYRHAAVLACFVSSQAEYVALSNKLLSLDMTELKKKIIVLAHPPGVKIDRTGLLKVHGCYELTTEHCDAQKFATHVLNLIRKSAKVYLEYKDDPMLTPQIAK